MAYKESLVRATLPAPAFRADLPDLTAEQVAALPKASCPVLSPPGSEQYEEAEQELADAAFDAATALPPTSANGLTSRALRPTHLFRFVLTKCCAVHVCVGGSPRGYI